MFCPSNASCKRWKGLCPEFKRNAGLQLSLRSRPLGWDVVELSGVVRGRFEPQMCSYLHKEACASGKQQALELGCSLQNCLFVLLFRSTFILLLEGIFLIGLIHEKC